MTALFGTDGVRGPANKLLTPELAVALARATAGQLLPEGGRMIIGRDTRNSGSMLEAALASGFAAAGVDVYLAGIIPTPAISFLIKDERADLGAVISASHNPPEDNGIKFFSRRGMKLDVDQEAAIEAAIGDVLQPGIHSGKIVPLEAAATRYAAFLAGVIDVEHIDLSELTIVADCAYGATAKIAPHVLRHIGAQVVALHDDLDGDRINQNCGSTCLDPLRHAVRSNRADLGVAFDGDGDRVLLVDRDGETIDGDRMIGIAALCMAEEKTLSPSIVVTTVMSNIGLETHLEAHGIEVVRTPVGDRHVSKRMHEMSAWVGGEPSGHVIFSEHSPTGDGILTAVKLLEMAHRKGVDLGALARSIPLYPQILRNVPSASPGELVADDRVQSAVDAAKTELGKRGQVLLRASGTQPLVRILVEADDEATCLRIADALERALEDAKP